MMRASLNTCICVSSPARSMLPFWKTCNWARGRIERGKAADHEGSREQQLLHPIKQYRLVVHASHASLAAAALSFAVANAQPHRDT